MGAFDKRKKELELMEKEVDANPTAMGYVNVVERYMAINEHRKAMDVARRALERFPASERVQLTLQNVRRVALQEELAALQKELVEKPNAQTYERLARVNLDDLGNKSKAQEVALDGLLRYPNNDGLHLVAGQIRLERYHADFLPNDFIEAKGHLEEAIRLNGKNFKARLLLARMFAEVGMPQLARPILEKLRQEAPDEVVEKLYKAVEHAAPVGAADLETRLSELENKGTLDEASKGATQVFARGGAGKAMVQRPAVDAFIRRLEFINGFKCGAIVTKSGDVVGKSIKIPELDATFGPLVHEVYKASETASNRMDIGSFVSGEIDTPHGTLAVSECGNLILGILAGNPARRTELSKALEDFVSLASPA